MGSNQKQTQHGPGHPSDGHNQHHILPTPVALGIGFSLMCLTVVTVWIAGIDLGELNFIIAMAVATVKALLVILFFMGLKYDRRENGMIFATSFVFLAIFMVLTSTDIFFRGDIYVKGKLGTFEGNFGTPAAQKSRYKAPWVSSAEQIAHGKELFGQQCVSCHGVAGAGDGPAASALTPRPRNFTSGEGWKNGRKSTQVFRTLNEGLPPSAMASFSTLPVDDRWALAHYVISLGPPMSSEAAQNTAADFAKVGLDPTKDGGGGQEAASIPMPLALDLMKVAESSEASNAQLHHPGTAEEVPMSGGKGLFRKHCAECHNGDGRGGIKVQNLGVNPIAYVTTESFKKSTESLRSQEEFSRLVVRGLPGSLMPGVGHLTTSEMRELYEYVKGISASR